MIKLIVGLGNPGSEHAGDRHNAGAEFVEALAQAHNQALTVESKFHGLTAKIQIAGQNVRLLIPTTFMNRSGQSVAAICQFFKFEPESVLIAHDELDLAPGDTRYKIGGGHGGHNGLRDIISKFGNNKNFARLRIGIGHPGSAKQVSNYVLKPPCREEKQQIDDSINRALNTIEDAVSGNFEKAMRQLHGKN